RRVDAASGIITTIAQEQEPATDIAFDSAGSIFLSEGTNFTGSLQRVRKIDARTGIITTVAGSDIRGYSGDGGPALLAQLNQPQGIVLDGEGNLFIADSANHVIRRVNAGTRTIDTVAGTGVAGFRDGPAALAQFRYPDRMVLDPDGNIYIADFF